MFLQPDEVCLLNLMDKIRVIDQNQLARTLVRFYLSHGCVLPFLDKLTTIELKQTSTLHCVVCVCVCTRVCVLAMRGSVCVYARVCVSVCDDYVCNCACVRVCIVCVHTCIVAAKTFYHYHWYLFL